jgi:hypothetical protein
LRGIGRERGGVGRVHIKANCTASGVSGARL